MINININHLGIKAVCNIRILLKMKKAFILISIILSANGSPFLRALEKVKNGVFCDNNGKIMTHSEWVIRYEP